MKDGILKFVCQAAYPWDCLAIRGNDSVVYSAFGSGRRPGWVSSVAPFRFIRVIRVIRGFVLRCPSRQSSRAAKIFKLVDENRFDNRNLAHGWLGNTTDKQRGSPKLEIPFFIRGIA